MKTLYSIVFVLFVLSAMGQKKSGQIVFVETMKMELNFEGADAERFKAMMPKERKSKYQLVFSEDASLYQSYEGGSEDDEKEMTWSHNTSEGEAVMKVNFARPANKYFIDLEDQRLVNKREFMGKNFLILGDSDDLKWKLSGESKEIAGYVCNKAVLQDTSEVVEAWFTPQIAVSSGPMQYYNLPGMILELSLEDGKTVVTAEKIEFRDVESNELNEPSGGKKVSSEEFDKIVEEKMKEMKDSKGGNRVIIMERN